MDILAIFPYPSTMRQNRLVFALVVAVPLVLVVACEDAAPPSSGSFDGGSSNPSGFDSSAPFDGAPTSVPDAAKPDAGDAVDATVPCPIGFEETVSGVLKVTADDYLKLWVNGALVVDKKTTWGTIERPTITLYRSPQRKNVIAVEARNAFLAGGYDRGLLADLELDAGADAGPDGAPPHVVTDLSWRIVGDLTDGGIPDGGLPDGGTAGVPGWFDLAFDDSTWHIPTDQGPHGMGPYGSVFGTSLARWLWSYDSSSATTKPVTEFVYFRKELYLTMDGIPSATPPACP